MSPMNETLINRNSIFGWLALGTTLLLMIPLIAMQFTTEVSWQPMDFIIMGVMLFGISSGFVLVARKIPQKRRFLTGAIFLFAFIWLWAELAVGVFTNWGS